MTEDKLVTAKEYCEHHNITRNALYLRRKKNQVKYIQYSEKFFLYYLNSYNNPEKRGGKR